MLSVTCDSLQLTIRIAELEQESVGCDIETDNVDDDDDDNDDDEEEEEQQQQEEMDVKEDALEAEVHHELAV